ncbi:11093_t:CDS:2 [Funneliformis geosporum]|uniref:11093_t:CDS:1 n=1 Tax=Funneliformis geosporum TaxID=1117311 RepID=A0A9W4T3A4_9GLOM|nr:11093_t:CDS:2 [Funneliformis geosporum]
MPCNLNVICFIDQYNETPEKFNFVVTAVGIISSRQQNTNIFIHIIAFYPKNTTRDNDLERFEKGDIIRVQGKFSIIETEVDGKNDLPKSSLSIILVSTASDNSETNDDQNNKSLSFDLYHFSEESHLLPITSKVSHGLSLYITGSLSLIDDHLLIRLIQINFIENTSSSPNKTSSYA